MKIFNFLRKKPDPTPQKQGLKNKAAEALRQKKIINIDGIEVNLWQNHSQHSINTQQTWNKIKSYTDLNENTTGESGNLVITGTFQIPRKEAADYAIKLGFNVRSGVSKFTDYVVVGSENVSPTKVAKALKVNKKIDNKIKFIDENTFLELVIENHLL